MGHFSALAGGVALGMILVPIVARTTEEMVRLVPNSLREAALALGYPRWRTSLQVVVRTAGAGIVTGCLVAVARVAGETAPLLFTALGNPVLLHRVQRAMAALPLQIYVYAVGPYDEWHRQAWAGALVFDSCSCCRPQPRWAREVVRAKLSPARALAGRPRPDVADPPRPRCATPAAAPATVPRSLPTDRAHRLVWPHVRRARRLPRLPRPTP